MALNHNYLFVFLCFSFVVVVDSGDPQYSIDFNSMGSYEQEEEDEDDREAAERLERLVEDEERREDAARRLHQLRL